ncbi:MAG: carbamoyl phosphate synthase small subunit, partial [Bacillus sp. (in: firmicutes)]|nr:carbamoyl phosphate synthase small subunit [Bacillus sp. (in: firmicutes)]
MKRQLILEDGTILVGEGFGSDVNTIGEVVFNTGMTGYQEILSDPSYCGQLVTLTYPLVGNYGINRDDFESIQPAIKGFIVKEASDFPSNWRNQMSLDEYFRMKNIPGISGIDTRKLTRIIRNHGTLKGAFCNIDEDAKTVLETLRAKPLANDQVKQVSTVAPYA